MKCIYCFQKIDKCHDPEKCCCMSDGTGETEKIYYLIEGVIYDGHSINKKRTIKKLIKKLKKRNKNEACLP